MTDEPIAPPLDPVPQDPVPAGVPVIDPPADPVPNEAGWHVPPTDCGTATLVVKRAGAETDISFPVSPPAIIGRFDASVGPIDVDLADLPEGSYVSRKHARLSCEGGIWSVKDLGSSNGTFLLRDDFERVEEAQLKNGDEIALGNARFVFRLS